MSFPAVDPGAARRLASLYDEGARVFREIARLAIDQRSAIACNDTDRLARAAERAEDARERVPSPESTRLGLAAAGAIRGAHRTRPRGNAGERGRRALQDARRRLIEAVGGAALAASQCPDLPAPASAVTAAIHRVLEGAAGAGYLTNAEKRPQPRGRRRNARSPLFGSIERIRARRSRRAAPPTEAAAQIGERSLLDAARRDRE
jgi:hypothetical protein